MRADREREACGIRAMPAAPRKAAWIDVIVLLSLAGAVVMAIGEWDFDLRPMILGHASGWGVGVVLVALIATAWAALKDRGDPSGYPQPAGQRIGYRRDPESQPPVRRT